MLVVTGIGRDPQHLRAHKVELRFENEDVVTVEPVGSSAGFAVNFFLFELDSEDRPVSLAAFDAEGQPLGDVRALGTSKG